MSSSGLSKQIFYVPQRPYVSFGTLRSQLTYPTPADRDELPDDEMVRPMLLPANAAAPPAAAPPVPPACCRYSHRKLPSPPQPPHAPSPLPPPFNGHSNQSRSCRGAFSKLAERWPLPAQRSLLARVDLQHLLDGPGEVEAVVDWGETLTLGEQQRLGLARLFHRRPQYAILDECKTPARKAPCAAIVLAGGLSFAAR